MNQGHCSFCDCYPLEDRSKEPIEHFKPKSRPEFYREAFSWENLYYCCDFCQNEKKEKWNAALLRPDSPDYEFDDYFEFDFTTGSIRPNLIAAQDKQERAQITIELYGLDTQQRRRFRLEFVEHYREGADIDRFSYRDFVGTYPR